MTWLDFAAVILGIMVYRFAKGFIREWLRIRRAKAKGEA